MKVLVFFCIMGLTLALTDSEAQSCVEEPDPGMCRGMFPMFYYDYQTRSCKEFIYGGCGGNDNKYRTEEECMSKCGDVVIFASEPVCEAIPDSGDCMAYVERYYFDKFTGRCKEFIYSGCGGNGNNFPTLEECEKRCESSA